jgi:hypothetical protein
VLRFLLLEHRGIYNAAVTDRSVWTATNCARYSADFEGKKKIYADPEFRRVQIETRVKARTVLSPTDGIARWFHSRRSALAERNLNEVARERGLDPIDLALDKVGASKLRRVYDLQTNQDRLIVDAEGIDAVIVNGTVIRRENKDQVAADGSLPGQLSRHGHARK